MVVPIRTSCNAVLYYARRESQFRGRGALQIGLTFEICVGRTSADGMEKSQYRLNVFCNGTARSNTGS